MNVLQRKQWSDYNDKLNKIFELFKFKKSILQIKGSGSLKIINYISDYDLYTDIEEGTTANLIYEELKRILEKINNNNDVYFIELKVQTLKNKKTRFYKDTLKDFEVKNISQNFDNLDFIKIDTVARIDNIFNEITCIYKINKSVLTPEKYIKMLKDDIQEYVKEKDYYKSLKRLFNIYVAEGNDQMSEYLIRVFNSPLGSIYSRLCNLSAIKLLLEHYKDDDIVKQKIIVNLKDIREPEDITSIDRNIMKYFKELNTQAKPIYDKVK